MDNTIIIKLAEDNPVMSKYGSLSQYLPLAFSSTRI